MDDPVTIPNCIARFSGDHMGLKHEFTPSAPLRYWYIEQSAPLALGQCRALNYEAQRSKPILKYVQLVRVMFLLDAATSS